MTNLEWAKALIAAAEQTYIKDYYGENVIPLFTRNEVALGADANTQHVESTEG